MSNRRYVYVTNFGMVYRLSRTAYRKALQGIVSGEGYNLAKLGKCVCYIDQDLTDVEPATAEELLTEETP